MRRHGGGSTAAGEGAMDIMAVIFLVLGGLAAAAQGARAAAAGEGVHTAAVKRQLGLAARLAVNHTPKPAGGGALFIGGFFFLAGGVRPPAALGARAAAAREGFLPAAVNGLLGLAALLAVNLTTRYTGLHLGFNLFNGLTAGILGVPGVVLLLLVQWVIT